MSDIKTEGALRIPDLDDDEAGILAYSIEGKITAEQAKEIFDRIEIGAAAGRRLRVYYEMQGFPKSEPSVFLEKLKRLGTILKTVERLAIVGDQRWLALYTAIFDPITRAELRRFKTDERGEAAAWIRE